METKYKQVTDEIASKLEASIAPKLEKMLILSTPSEGGVVKKYMDDGWTMLRCGWPDFLATKGDEIKFVEVKREEERGQRNGGLNEAQMKMRPILEKLAPYAIEYLTATEPSESAKNYNWWLENRKPIYDAYKLIKKYMEMEDAVSLLVSNVRSCTEVRALWVINLWVSSNLIHIDETDTGSIIRGAKRKKPKYIGRPTAETIQTEPYEIIRRKIQSEMCTMDILKLGYQTVRDESAQIVWNYTRLITMLIPAWKKMGLIIQTRAPAGSRGGEYIAAEKYKQAP